MIRISLRIASKYVLERRFKRWVQKGEAEFMAGIIFVTVQLISQHSSMQYRKLPDTI
jgi:hypothetical protein